MGNAAGPVTVTATLTRRTTHHRPDDRDGV